LAEVAAVVYLPAMLDLRYVSENLDEVRGLLARRGFEDPVLSRVRDMADERRSLIAEAEGLRATRNEVSKAMGTIADKKSDAFSAKRDEMRAVGDRIKGIEERLGLVEGELDEILLHLPNVPHDSTPPGTTETDNVVVRTCGEHPAFDFARKDHVDLGSALGILDFERGAKLSGARFTVLRGLGARLERALVSFMLDLHTADHGYEEIWPPALVRGDTLRGTGQLPKFSADLFKIARDAGWEQHQEGGGHDLYLSPTAEVQLTNLRADEILEASELPVRYTAYTPCFRAEAGSHGKDTRGFLRQHQFDKVELVHLCRPEDGEAQLEELTGHAEEVLKRLGLCYRVTQLCAGDMSFSAQKTYDIEVWLPGQDAYREISSCSWCGDYQARRARLRYRPEAKAKPRLVHTLNGSGLAIGRTLIAILEQFQQADGSVRVPEALQPYMRGVTRIGP
jgi:seryl-tRNA synthetase